jgi:hypothetical protein
VSSSEIVKDDDPVTITRGQLGYLLLVGCRYNSRFPYGVPPPEFWALLSDKQRAALNADLADPESE